MLTAQIFTRHRLPECPDRQSSRRVMADSQWTCCVRSIRYSIFISTLIAIGSVVPADQAFGWPQSDPDVQLYFFTNDGCAPCLVVAPEIEALRRSGYPVQTIKTDQHARFADQLQVDRTPTVVMTANNRIVGRHSGLIDQSTLRRWFNEVGYRPTGNTRQASQNRPAANQRSARPPAIGTKTILNRDVTRVVGAGSKTANFSTPTMHRGTQRPRSAAERRAMLATVKLKVEDPEGISYATGTVIHTHGTESLVMTCGHVFRDSNGTGRITADYDIFGDRATAPGRLVDYDAGARDVGLVVIKTSRPITPVPLADQRLTFAAELDVFSIGCDHGQDPTIRRTRIKDLADYDGAIKYDIFGRPVDGRSGGGLFTTDGQLIGVCNSAAVEVDEGIYTAIDTLYWQVESVGLVHLFDNSVGQRLAATPDRLQNRLAELGSNNRDLARQLNRPRDARAASIRPPMARIQEPEGLRQRRDVGLSLPRQPADAATADSPSNESFEVVIEVRSKSDPRQREKIVINDPTPQLIQYLNRMNNP